MKTHGRTSCEVASGATLLPALVALWLVSSSYALAAPQSAPAQNSEPAELTSHETQPTFKLKSERNLVVVRVVARDANGNARGSLRQEDFRLLDNGKPQTILHFSVESPSAAEANRASANQPAASRAAEAPAPQEATDTPHRFLALFFDDLHLRIEDNMRVQRAAIKYLAGEILPGDRVALFTSSGRNQVDFTDDREKVRQAISHIMPRPIISVPDNVCPEIFDYQAYLMVHQRDSFATEIAVEEYYQCNCVQYDSQPILAAQCRERGAAQSESSAVQVLSIYETNTQAALRTLEQAVRHVAGFPGQRSIVLVSPGFLARGFETQLDQIVDRALRANITLSALDAKGLYAPLPGGDDISKMPMLTPKRPDLVGRKEQLRIDRVTETADPLRHLALDTGGVFFQNSNDLDEGFRRTGALPEVYYVLSFSPSTLKQDGGFHSLKVSLLRPAGLSLQSRRGYFAPSPSADPASQAKAEIEEAIFSQDETNELPIEVHTQFFRVNESAAKLSVLTHLDLRLVRFRKQEGRNLDNLTVVTVLFDRNGQYVTGQEKTVEMRLLDTSLQKLSPAGITMKTSFDVKPGTYLVRQVVRDTEGAQLSGLNRTVEIPH